MAARKKSSARKTSRRVEPVVTREERSSTFYDRIQSDLDKNKSYLNLVLGVLVIVVLGALLFNFFRKSPENSEIVNPAAQTQNEQGDVAKDKLPGKYTVKEGDTLFTIAEKYYNSGWEYTKIAEANKLGNVDSIELGQVLEIPKLDQQVAQATASPSPSPEPEQKQANLQEQEQQQTSDLGQGGATNQTIWGEKITGNTYTVVEGDWLSTISGRAYGDIMQYEKIAKANNIQNPDVIEPGMNLNIPR